jgi:hypothetical protein
LQQESLKRLNNLESDMFLAASSVLKIPVVPGNTGNQPIKNTNVNLIKQFCASEKCTSFEAKTYLAEHNYDLEAAIAARRAKLNQNAGASETPAPAPAPAPLVMASLSQPNVKYVSIGQKFKVGNLTKFFCRSQTNKIDQPRKVGKRAQQKMEERSDNLYDL